jgi:hypothetical protein
MSRVVISIAAGAVSGVAVWLVSLYTLAYTNAWAMPPSFPLKVWSALVVFGVGVSAVALAIHFAVLRTIRGHPAPALAGCAAAFVAALAVSGQLQFGQAVTAAALAGAAVASVLQLRLWPNNSSKPTPLRGAA